MKRNHLKEEHSKKVFPILANQDSTELDALFINSPSYLGHATNLSYYIEIETQRRDSLAFQRLIDFSNFCKSKSINLCPILITGIRKTGYVQDVCVFNIDELKKTGVFYERYINRVEQIPGLAHDDATSCFYIIDVISQKERFIKEELFTYLKNCHILRRDLFNLHKFVDDGIDLMDSIELETATNFNRRLNKYILLLKNKNLIMDTLDGRAHQLTTQGGKLILKWRSKYEISSR